MFFKDLCILVLWAKVALALEGFRGKVSIFMLKIPLTGIAGMESGLNMKNIPRKVVGFVL